MNALSLLRSKPHLSVSQIKAFLQCPRKYFFQYVEGVTPTYRPFAFAFGTAWHETIGRHLLTELTLEELQQVFRDALQREVAASDVPVLFEDNEGLGSAIDLGLRMLDVFLARVDEPEGVIGVEVAFSVSLADPTTGEILPVPLIGAVDAIVVENKRPVIWELKTAKKRWSNDLIEFDLQPTAYKIGARVFDLSDVDLKLLVTTKTKSPDVQIENLTRHEADEKDLVTTAASVLRAIEAGVDHPVRGWQCRSCPYASHCR